MGKKMVWQPVAWSMVVLLAAAWLAPAPASGGDPGLAPVRAGYADCGAAQYEVSALPFADSGVTTGQGDDYNLGAAGICAGGGTQFLSTGLGDDTVYLIATDFACTLDISMDPTGAEDLALYVLHPDCSDEAGNCVTVSDAGAGGITESVTVTTTAGQPYYVIVDGYNNASGPYDLSIVESTATGCALVDPQAGFDLGDAPDSSNHDGKAMTAYAAGGGPPYIAAGFPTVYDPATGLPQGPRHLEPGAVAWLGSIITEENDADLLPDVDGATNIDPVGDIPDRDGGDDGVQLPLDLPDCSLTVVTYTLTVAPGAAAVPRFVNVWFDWNRDGDWQDVMICPGPLTASEWAVQDVVVTVGPGTHTLATSWLLPYNPDPDEPMWMRISVAEQPAPTDPTVAGLADGRGPAGGYLIGETEDYYLGKQVQTVYLPLIVRNR